jgi:RNA polymerase sigma-70 factor, ECF subfamily
MQSSDHERFTQVWTQAQPIVSSYINSVVPDFHEAQDVLQKVSIILLRKFSEYDSARPFVSWAIGIARFEILATRRSHARSFLTFRPEIVETISQAYAEMAPELDERTHALRDCIKQIQGHASEVLKLRYEKALSPKAIADIAGMTAGAVRVMLLRIRSSLKKCIDQKIAAQGGLS